MKLPQRVILFITLITIFAASFSTKAEIYKCVSADGVAKFSNRPCPKKQLNGKSEPYQFYKELKTLIGENQTRIKSVGGDTASIMACQTKVKQDLKSYPALHSKAAEMSKYSDAYPKVASLAEQCVGCAYRHLSFCEKALAELDKIKSDLVNSQFVYKPPAWLKKY